MKISVLMCVYKEPLEWIKDAIHSILNQTYTNIEFVIVNDYPESLPLMELLDGFAEKYRQIILLKNPTNLGLVKSLNTGLKHCTGEYIARMDADDVSRRCRLEKQLGYLIDGNFDLVGCQVKRLYGGQLLDRASYELSNRQCRRSMRYTNPIAHPAWFVRREVYDVLGGYREIEACEDYDFLIRAVQQNFKLGNAPDILMNLRKNPKSITHVYRLEQKVISDYLAVSYRKRHEITEEEYGAYRKSTQFRERMDVTKKILWAESELRNGNAKRKIRVLTILITEKDYVSRKLMNQYTKAVRFLKKTTA